MKVQPEGLVQWNYHGGLVPGLLCPHTLDEAGEEDPRDHR